VDITSRFAAALTQVQTSTSEARHLPDQLATTAARVLAVDGVGLSLAAEQPAMPGASGELPAVAEQLQFTVGTGPCLVAVDTQFPLLAVESYLQRRWPAYQDLLRTRTPYRSVVALPMDQGLARVGAMVIYLEDPAGPLDFDSFDAHAVVSLVSAELSASPAWATRHQPGLQQSTASRPVCRGRCRSPSGRLLARYRIGHDQRYGHVVTGRRPDGLGASHNGASQLGIRGGCRRRGDRLRGCTGAKATTMTSNGDSLRSDTTLALQRINTLTLSEHSMATVLQAVVDETTATLPGDLHASVSVRIGTRPATLTYSGQLALDLDETQYERGHGPCLHAATTGEPVEITDARNDTRWPDYTPRAVQRGSFSSLSLPLAELTAALNIYATQAHGFDAATRTAAGKFAASAATAISNMHAYQTARDTVTNLEVALQSRAAIDQAKGILMERHRLTADQAFQFLVHASQAANVTLRDVADHLIHTGETLGPPNRLHRTTPPRNQG